ncbi:MAG: hypothetical protein JWM34_397 [Ilumatobacteraceae bacterium]|nr:hypothetical protein [Ilumatobacteraceae bacterium]
MPTYVYKFIETGETIEVQQAFSDDALTEAVHPGTGATMPVKKVFLPVGVTFKGGGFYKTDSRGGSSSSSTAPASSGSGGDSGSSSSSSSDSGSSSSTSSSGSSGDSSKSSSSSAPATPAPAKASSSD